MFSTTTSWSGQEGLTEQLLVALLAGELWKELDTVEGLQFLDTVEGLQDRGDRDLDLENLKTKRPCIK